MRCPFCPHETRNDTSHRSHVSRCPFRNVKKAQQQQTRRQARDELWEAEEDLLINRSPSPESPLLVPHSPLRDGWVERGQIRKPLQPLPVPHSPLRDGSLERDQIRADQRVNSSPVQLEDDPTDVPVPRSRYSSPSNQFVDPSPSDSEESNAFHIPTHRTPPDYSGLFRIYQYNLPSRIPDSASYNDSSELNPNHTYGQRKNDPLNPPPAFFASEPPKSLDHPTQPSILDRSSYAPFDSPSEYLLINWAYTHNRVTGPSMKRLVQVLKNPAFSAKDLPEDFDFQRSSRKMDAPKAKPCNASSNNHLSTSSELPFVHAAPDVWVKGSVNIPMPKAGHAHESEADFPQLTLGEAWHRKPLDAIVYSFQEPSFYDYHLKPFKLFHTRNDGTMERVYGEAFTSDRAWQFEQEIHATLPQKSHCENVVVLIMLWSDSTHLAQFGNASLWPIYMQIGNQSKYIRVRPSAYATHHIAYLPSIPDLACDVYSQVYGSNPTPAVMRFLKREVYHAILFLLFDEEFRKAYVDGHEVICMDDVLRALYPRFFSYGMDMMDKIIVICVKFLGEHLCIRCTIRTKDVFKLGQKQDMINRIQLQRTDSDQHQQKIEHARSLIFNKGYSVESRAVKNLLDSESLTPTRNALSTLFQKHGFDIFKVLTPDKLHEWKVGRGKDMIVQIVRILHSIGVDAVTLFDRRYRWVPTFSRGVIRRFHNNVSEMKALAGRDHVAILKCMLPCIKGLFPKHHDKDIQDILFDCNTWQLHTDLRMQTDTTVATYKLATVDLGNAFRKFANKTCPDFDTVELPRERAARLKRQSSAKKSDIASSSNRKTFSLSTPKTHLLGDYPWSIVYFGTTDSTDTAICEGAHQTAKQFYGRVGKNDHVGQIAQLERRVRYMNSMRQGRAKELHTTPIAVPAWEEEYLPQIDRSTQYQMASGRKFFINLSEFVYDNRNDPALTGFMVKLKHYVLNQLFGKNDFSEQEYGALTFESNRIYRHKVVRVNYTSYDLRRGQDSINPRTHPDIAVLAAPGSSHPFVYGRVIGVFHANVRFTSPLESSLKSIPVKPVDILWVRWYEFDASYKSGWRAKRLPRIKFVHASDPDAFGFLHPSDIIRSMHVIGDFGSLGSDNGLPENSVGRQFEALAWSGPREREEDDWNYYFVNMFVESDIFMLFRGGGLGHKELHEYLRPFAIDAGLDTLELPKYDLDGKKIEFGVSDVDEDDESETGEKDGSQDGEIGREPTGEEVEEELEEQEEERELETEEDEMTDNEWFENLGPEDGDDQFGP